MDPFFELVDLVAHREFSLARLQDVRRWGEKLGLEHLGDGRHRVTFRNPYTNSVIKIPWNLDGAEANLREYDYFVQDRDPRYARCSLEMVENVPVLHMEAVRPPSHYWTLPDWCDWIDCSQVGYAIDGRIVAYDYADSRL